MQLIHALQSDRTQILRQASRFAQAAGRTEVGLYNIIQAASNVAPQRLREVLAEAGCRSDSIATTSSEIPSSQADSDTSKLPGSAALNDILCGAVPNGIDPTDHLLSSVVRSFIDGHNDGAASQAAGHIRAYGSLRAMLYDRQQAMDKRHRAMDNTSTHTASKRKTLLQEIGTLEARIERRIIGMKPSLIERWYPPNLSMDGETVARQLFDMLAIHEFYASPLPGISGIPINHLARLLCLTAYPRGTMQVVELVRSFRVAGIIAPSRNDADVDHPDLHEFVRLDQDWTRRLMRALESDTITESDVDLARVAPESLGSSSHHV